MFLVVVALGRL